ncbi:pentapeptide repeat-containing protein [Galactobacter caseinivorans]|uniref:Pentapeptide repeat-containing protein n=2 Tax=Galactobacter caseinivorans TaxID=2676123 RepID=A0A496PJ63_9MICC|nr:pentapeptide repeat-containing protein [Galactobacter caseinivorans]
MHHAKRDGPQARPASPCLARTVLTRTMSASRSVQPATPRVPLAEPSSSHHVLGWDEMGLGGEFDGARLEGASGATDLSDVTFRDCVVARADLSGADLTRSRWEGSLLEGVFADELRAGKSSWRNVMLRQSRMGVLDLVDAKVQAVRIGGAKLGRVDLRRAIVTDLLIEDAVIEELDLDEAKATRISFSEVHIGRLSLHGSVLKDVDLRGARLAGVGPVMGLRGAIITDWQLQELAPALAADLGLRVLGEG